MIRAGLIVLLWLLTASTLGSVRLSPIYAHEAGNWPLETFAANGLFRQIARYQQGHPRAVTLTRGHYTLDSLAGQVGEQVLSRQENGWVLHYPLVIAPGASLSIRDSSLFIEGRHGGCLINRGTLTLQQARIRSDGGADSGFIHGWGGSSTTIENSTLTGLGRADFRASGLSVARHRYQGPLRPATLTVARSHLADLYRGVDAEPGSQVHLEDVVIENSREQGVVIQGASSQLDRLTVRHSRSHGVRLGGGEAIALSSATLEHNGGAGLLVENHTEALAVRQLHSQYNREYGLQIKGNRATHATHLAQLHLAGNGSDGLRLDGIMTLTLSEARIDANQRYAISLQGAAQQPITATLANLQLHHNRLAALHTGGEGELTVTGLSLRHHSNRGQYLAGNLAAHESRLLPPLLKGERVQVTFTDSPPTDRLATRR